MKQCITRHLIIVISLFLFIRPGTIQAQSLTPQQTLPGDTNDDQLVNHQDYLNILSSMNKSAGDNASSDLNHDGFINIFELNQVISHFSPNLVTPTPPNQVSSYNLRASTGISSMTNESWLALPTATKDSYISTNHFLPAINSAKSQYGSEPPKIVIYISNLGSQNTLINQLTAEFPQSIIAGVANNTAQYNGYTQSAFIDIDQRSIAILALGGNNLTNISTYQTPVQSSIGTNQDHINTGIAIANLFKDDLEDNQNNIIFMLGGGHTPRLMYFMCGMKSVLIDNTQLCNASYPTNGLLTAIPQESTYFIGAAGDDGSSTTAGTTTLANSLTAVLIQGNYELDISGIGNNFSGNDPITVSQSLLQSITDTIGSPDLVFYIPGHPESAQNGLARTPAQMLDAARQILGTNTPMFGQRGGGEYGHRNNNDNIPIGAANYAFYLGIRGVDQTPE